MREDVEGMKVREGEVYIAIRQVDVVHIIKQSRIEGLVCGTDFGLLAYNETPAYEVIDRGNNYAEYRLGKDGDIDSRFYPYWQADTYVFAYRDTFERIFIGSFLFLVSAQFSTDGNVLLI